MLYVARGEATPPGFVYISNSWQKRADKGSYFFAYYCFISETRGIAEHRISHPKYLSLQIFIFRYLGTFTQNINSNNKF